MGHLVAVWTHLALIEWRYFLTLTRSVLADRQRPDFFIRLIEEQIGSVLGNMKMITGQ